MLSPAPHSSEQGWQFLLTPAVAGVSCLKINSMQLSKCGLLESASSVSDCAVLPILRSATLCGVLGASMDKIIARFTVYTSGFRIDFSDGSEIQYCY